MAWWTNKDGIGIKNDPSTRWSEVEDPSAFESMFEDIRKQIADQADEIRFEAFEKCGYSREFILDPENRTRIACIGTEGRPDVELWMIDGVPKFELIKEFEWKNDGLVLAHNISVRYL